MSRAIDKIWGIIRILEIKNISIGTHKIEIMKNPIAELRFLNKIPIIKAISRTDNKIKIDAKKQVTEKETSFV